MKKFNLFAITILILFLFTGQIRSQALDTKTLSYIDSLVNSNYPPDGPGLSLLIAKGGNTLYKKAFGMSDIEKNVKLNTDNVLAIGSMTKQFTAVCILQLVNEGKINLNDEVKKYLTDYNSHNKTITIENCLRHSSGIPSFTEKNNFDSIYKKSLSKDEMVNFFENDELFFEPGSDFSYSNSGYFLLGLIIEKVSGMSYEDYVQKNIFDKIGMKNSYFGKNENNIPGQATGYEPKDEKSFQKATFFDWSWPYSAGNILSTTNDLLLWNEALNSDKIVPQSLLKNAWKSYQLANGTQSNYGYGWNVTSLDKYTVIRHGGAISGYLSDGIRIPEEDLYIIALSNNTGKTPEVVTTDILLKLLNIKDENPVRILLDNNSLDEYTGAFEVNRNGGRLINKTGGEKQYRYIIRQGDSLILKRTGGGTFGFFPYAKDKFFTEGSDKRFDFIRDNSGNISALEVYEYPISFGPHDICMKADVPLPTEKSEVTVSPEIMKKYEGEYELMPGFTLKMFIEDGNLFTQATGQTKIQLFAESDTKFFMKIVDAQIDFIPDEDGSVNKLILTQGQKFECKRIK